MHVHLIIVFILFVALTPISPLAPSPTPLQPPPAPPSCYFEREERIRCAAFDVDLYYGDAITFLNAEQTPDGIDRMFDYYESVFNLCKKARPIRGRYDVPSHEMPEMKTFPRNLYEWKVHFKYMGSTSSLDNICYYKYVAGAIRYYNDIFNVPVSWKCVHFLAYKIVIDTIPAAISQKDPPMIIDNNLDECVICFQETIWKTPCLHRLCRTCENVIITCPICCRQLKPIHVYNSYIYKRIEEFCKGLLNKCNCMIVY